MWRDGVMGAREILDIHHGIVRTAQYRSLRTQWWRGVRSGNLVQALPGVVMDKGLEPDPRAWIRATALWNPNAVISGAAAAALTFDPGAEVTTIDVHVKGELADRGPIRFRRDTIDPELLDWVDGIRVTGPVATAITAGIVGDFGPGTAALRMGATTPPAVSEHAAMWSQRSVVRARDVALALSGNPWSPAEVEAHELFRAAGVRGWAGNREVLVNGRRLVPDIGLHRARIAFEVNSFQFHSSRTAMEHDAARHNQFQSIGWDSYVLTPAQIRDHRAETIEFVRSVVWARHRRFRRTG